MQEQGEIDRKIIDIGYDYGNQLDFLADTLVKNLEFKELVEFNQTLADKANKYYNGTGAGDGK